MSEKQVDENFINTMRERLNTNPDDIEAAVSLGNYFFDQQLPPQSLVYYNMALLANPQQPGVRTDMGTMYWANGNFSHAEQNFRQVIDQYPGFGNAYMNLGLLYRNIKKDPINAIKIWKELVDGFPEDPAVDKVKQLLSEAMVELH